MGRGGYGTVDFWDEWYAEEEHVAPYDWLLAFEDVSAALEVLLPDHDARILVPGCGNSPFSSELFARGYRKLMNVDNCASIIDTQRDRYPMLDWRVADVRRLPAPDASVDVVLDKGLLDNLYCYADAADAAEAYASEVARVLRPGGRLVAFSCHDAAATETALERDAWDLRVREIPNPRWPRIKIPSYQIAVADRVGGEARNDLDALLDAAIGASAAAAPPPARLDSLDRRASGRRHSAIIAAGDAAAAAVA